MGFSEEIIQRVWEKADAARINNALSSEWRKDQCGAWIKRDAYGNRNSAYGWEIDHIKTQANGGGDEPSNLRPLHWENNLAKSDGNLKCKITSAGNSNIRKV